MTRPRTVAFAAAEGGVGRTACALAVGAVLAERTSLRVLACDTGRPAIRDRSLVAYGGASSRGSVASLSALDRVDSAAALRPYVSIHRSGLHVLSGSVPPDELSPLIFVCQRFYDLVLVDTTEGVTAPATRAALECAGHVVLVTTPDWRMASETAAMLERGLTGATVIVNRVADRTGARPARDLLAEAGALEVCLVREDRQLALALATATYGFAALRRATRLDLGHVAIRLLSCFEDARPRSVAASPPGPGDPDRQTRRSQTARGGAVA